MFLKMIDAEDAEQLWEYISRIPADENGFINELAGVPREGFEDQIRRMQCFREGEGLPEGYVPETVFVLWNDEHVPVGQFRLRHYLCDSLRNGAGHIGYSIRKEYRRRGYATEGLKLLLQEAQDLIPEPEAYLRVLKSNEPSLKVMLKNGARIAGEDEEHWLTRIPLRTDDRAPILESERINFVRLTPEMVDDYVRMVNDPQCSISIRNELVIMSKNDELLWIAKNRKKTDTLFSMTEKASGKFIGNIELFDKNENIATLGICLAPDMQDRHFGTESIRRMLMYGFDTLGLEQIRLDVFSPNKRAIHCYENIGFRRTGEKTMSAPDGTPITEIAMLIEKTAE